MSVTSFEGEGNFFVNNDGKEKKQQETESITEREQQSNGERPKNV